jgi:hypothetical protein
MPDHMGISEQVQDDWHSEEVWNIPLGVEDIPEDFYSDVKWSNSERRELCPPHLDRKLPTTATSVKSRYVYIAQNWLAKTVVRVVN